MLQIIFDFDSTVNEKKCDCGSIITNDLTKTHIEEKLNVKNNKCLKCGSKMKLIDGKYGEFFGCSNFPSCRFISNSKDQKVFNQNLI